MVKKALLIGINYEGSRLALNGCINDVDNVQAWLLEHCGFARENIVRMDDHTDVKPTRRNILAAIDDLVEGLQAGDEVVFQYSGHGSHVRDQNGDESDGQDEALVPLDYESAGLIIDDVLRARLCDAIPRDASLFAIIDACHSGTSQDLRYNFEDQSKYTGWTSASTYNPHKWATRTLAYTDRQYRQTRGNVLCISGCRDAQTSADAWIASEGYTGAMTFGLLKTLKRAKREGKKELSVQRLLKDVSCTLRVRKYTQIPRMSSGRKIELGQAVWVIY